MYNYNLNRGDKITMRTCQTSDRTAAFVHDLAVNRWDSVHSPDAGVASTSSKVSDGHLCIESLMISPICFL